jgi:DNA recombination protein RmuC
LHLAQLLVGVAVGLILGAVCAWLYAAARAARVHVLLQEREKDVAQLRALLEQTDTRLRDSFTALSSQALQANNQAFLDLARTSMGEFHRGAKAELEARQLSIAQLV